MSEKMPKTITDYVGLMMRNRSLLYVSSAAITALMFGSVYAASISNTNSDGNNNTSNTSAVTGSSIDKEDEDLKKNTKNGTDVSLEWREDSGPTGRSINTNISVDGETVKVPKKGKSHQIFGSKDGKTKIEVTSNSVSSGGNSRSSITELRVNSYTNTDRNNESHISRDNMP